MAINKIDGDVRRFLIINTTEYNEDGKYGVIDCSYYELDDYGFDVEGDDELMRLNTEKFIKIDDMAVGEVAESTSFRGAYVMRVA